ncbi:photosynthetic complex assembly protein PuhC [Thiocapsa imhoffii]|nr:photosynthetic complex assembly protein PuhC [Thiocapsa imhoffii]
MHDRPFPRGILIALAALIAFTVLAVGIARLSGFDPSQEPRSPATVMRDVRFVDADNGFLQVYDFDTGELIEAIEPNEDGFLRGLLRTLLRERRLHQTDLDGPYRVSLRENGHFTIEDLSTDFYVDLRPFGRDNEAAIGRFVASPQTSSQMSP